MKIILFKLWTNYTESIKEQSLHTAQVYLDKWLWNQWRTLHCTTKLLLYVHHRVCISESIRDCRKLRCNDKIFILVINRLPSSAHCSSQQHFMWGIDLNILKTTHDLLISIAVIVKTYNSCSKSIRESFTSNM